MASDHDSSKADADMALPFAVKPEPEESLPLDHHNPPSPHPPHHQSMSPNSIQDESGPTTLLPAAIHQQQYPTLSPNMDRLSEDVGGGIMNAQHPASSPVSPELVRRKDELVTGSSNSALRARLELTGYRDEVASARKKAADLDEQVDVIKRRSRRSAAATDSQSRITSLGSELSQHRLSLNSHCEQVRSYEDKLEQLGASLGSLNEPQQRDEENHREEAVNVLGRKMDENSSKIDKNHEKIVQTGEKVDGLCQKVEEVGQKAEETSRKLDHSSLEMDRANQRIERSLETNQAEVENLQNRVCQLTEQLKSAATASNSAAAAARPCHCEELKQELVKLTREIRESRNEVRTDVNPKLEALEQEMSRLAESLTPEREGTAFPESGCCRCC